MLSSHTFLCMDTFPAFGFFHGHDFPNRLNVAVIGLPTDQQQDLARTIAHPTPTNGYGVGEQGFWVQGTLCRYVFPIGSMLPQTSTVEIGVAFATQNGKLIAIEEPVYVAFFTLTKTAKPVQ